jgi:hypothetical protein
LGFLPPDRAPNDHERGLIGELWGLTKGEENKGVTFDTLKVVFLNMIGIKVRERQAVVPATPLPSDMDSQPAADILLQPAEEQQVNDAYSVNATEESMSEMSRQVDNRIVGLFKEDDRFFLRKGDHSKLFTHFKYFYSLRLQFTGLNSEYKKSLFDSYKPNEDVKSKPEINEKNTDLAKKKRTKLLKGQDPTLVSQVEIFLIPKLNQAKIDAKKQELLDKEFEQCSFAPKTLDYKGGSKKTLP